MVCRFIKEQMEEVASMSALLRVVERSRDAKKSRDVKYNFSANARYLKSIFQSQA